MPASSPSFHVESDINSRGNPTDLAKRHPELAEFMRKTGAAEETRTPDPIITNDVLYQLSYGGTFLVWPLLWPYYFQVKPRKRLVLRVIPGRTQQLRMTRSTS